MCVSFNIINRYKCKINTSSLLETIRVEWHGDMRLCPHKLSPIFVFKKSTFWCCMNHLENIPA